MGELPAEIDALLRQLEAAPHRLAAAATGLSAAGLALRTATEPWSIGDILAHLRASADVCTKFIHVLLTGTPAPRYVSPRAYIKQTGYLALAFSDSLPAYAAQRTRLLGELRALRADAWSRGVTVRNRPEEVLTFTRYLAQHEAVHCDQVERLARLVRQG